MKKVFLFLTTLISLSALTIDGSAQIDTVLRKDYSER